MDTANRTALLAKNEIPEDTSATPEWFVEALAAPREEGWLDLDGCSIHYFRWGDPAKPGIVLLHGFLAHARCFAFIAPLLADDYHVVAYDFSGMGDSGSRETYDDDVRLQELMDVSRETGLFANEHKPTIIAHSYGGSVGLKAAEEHHDLFSGLIICDLMTLRPERLIARAKDNPPPQRSDEKRENNVYPDYQTAKARFILSPPQAVNEPYLLDYMAYHSLKEVEGSWSWKFHPSVFGHTKDLPERLLKQGKRIADAPGRMAIVYGMESELFDADSAAYIQESGGEHIPMIAIPNARHHLMLDQPMAFTCVLKAILALWAQPE